MNAMPSRDNSRKKRLTDIAETTLDAIERGSYMVEGVGEIYLSEAISRCVENTRLYSPESVLQSWGSAPSSSSSSSLHRAQVRSSSLVTVNREMALLMVKRPSSSPRHLLRRLQVLTEEKNAK